MPKRLQHTLFAFIIGLFPIINIYAHNIYYVHAEQVFAPIAISLISSLLMLTILYSIYRNLLKAALFLSCFWLVFFSYTALHDFLIGNLGLMLITKQSFILASLTLGFALLGIVLYKIKVNPALIKIAYLFAAVLVIVPLYKISAYYFNEALVKPDYGLELKNNADASIPANSLPDIVYIILDGYGRQDILKQNYNTDNSKFINTLQSKGFFVAQNSFSNYCRTAVTASSVFNLNYLQNLEGFGEQQSYATLDELTERSLLVDFLKSSDYNIYSFASGFDITELTRDATFLTPNPSSISEFQFLVLNLTPFSIIENNTFLYRKYIQLLTAVAPNNDPRNSFRDNHRDRILFALDSIPAYVGQSKPSFVFADIFVGHPPFIFDEEGNYTSPKSKSPAADGSEFMLMNEGGREEYIKGCREQTLYLSNRITQTIEEIEKRATRPTVIILQGDHGPGAFYDQHDVSKTNLKDRFSILNALYLPGSSKKYLAEDLTPVNTFRIVLNEYFKTNLPLLPNKHYYSAVHTPCKFTDVTKPIEETKLTSQRYSE